jgi:hypothetical protein
MFVAGATRRAPWLQHTPSKQHVSGLPGGVVTFNKHLAACSRFIVPNFHLLFARCEKYPAALGWLRHRDVGNPQASESTMHQSLLAEPRACAPPLDFTQRSAETSAGVESSILKPSAPPAESEAFVGAAALQNARLFSHAVASPAHNLPGSQAPQELQHDDFSEDMTDQ